MGKLKIKVCGMRDENNIKKLTDIGPDYIGFIFYPSSKRYVEKYGRPSVIDHIPDRIQKVGVFVNETLDQLVKRVIEYNLDLVQLHGNEPVEYCNELKDMGFKLIKAFPVDENFDTGLLSAYTYSCDYFLFDTRTCLYGGSGEKFNWNILNKYETDTPFFLSGGIDPEDVEEIRNMNTEHIYAVDINSRFEIQPGLKDIKKIQRFIQTLNNE